MQWYSRMRVYLITHHFKIYRIFSSLFYTLLFPKQLIKYVQIGLIGLSLCPHHTENVFSLLGFH